MLKDEPAEQGLPVSGDGVHFVNGYAGADGGEGVAGEVEVGDVYKRQGSQSSCKHEKQGAFWRPV